MGERTIRTAFEELVRRTVPTQTERDAAARHRRSVEAALEPLDNYGLRETGSFHHGTGVRGHCDVDVIVSLKDDQPGNADVALSRVKAALERKFLYTDIRISRPAVVVEFAGGDERWEIIPGYFQRTEQDCPVYAIPAPGGTWMETAPQVHLRYVNEQNASPAGGAKSLARLIKAYKYPNIGGFKVSSFYLEMRAAKYMASETSFVPHIDFLRLGDVLVGAELASMNDPTGVTGRFRATSTESYRLGALSRLRADVERTREAIALEKAGYAGDAFAKLDTVFLHTFP